MMNIETISVRAASLLVSGLLIPAALQSTLNPRAEVTTIPAPKQKQVKPPKYARNFVATAYSISGTTALGHQTREGHTVAADPDVIPLGSRIRVTGAGRYSGTYLVTDTGSAIKGHIIDIYMGSTREAKVFGRRPVKVRVLSEPVAAGMP